MSQIVLAQGSGMDYSSKIFIKGRRKEKKKLEEKFLTNDSSPDLTIFHSAHLR